MTRVMRLLQIVDWKACDGSEADVIATFKVDLPEVSEPTTLTATAWPFVENEFEVLQQKGYDHVSTSFKFELPSTCPTTCVDLSKMLSDKGVGAVMEHLQKISDADVERGDESDDSDGADEGGDEGEDEAGGGTEVEFDTDAYNTLVSKLKRLQMEKEKFREAIRGLGPEATAKNLKVILLKAGMKATTLRGMMGRAKAEAFGWGLLNGLYFLPNEQPSTEDATKEVADRPSERTRNKDANQPATPSSARLRGTVVPTAPEVALKAGKQVKRGAEAGSSGQSPASKKSRQRMPDDITNEELKQALDIVHERATEGLKQLLNAKLIEYLTSNPTASPADVDEFRASAQLKIEKDGTRALAAAVKLLKDRLS